VVKRPPSRFTATDQERVLGSIIVAINRSRVCPLPFEETMRRLSKAVHARNQPEPDDYEHSSAPLVAKPVVLYLRPAPSKEGALLVVSIASAPSNSEVRLNKQVRHIRLVNGVLYCYHDAKHQKLVTKFELTASTSLLLNPPLVTNTGSPRNTTLPFSFEIEWRHQPHTSQFVLKADAFRSRLLVQAESRSEMITWASTLKYSIMVLQGHQQIIQLEHERVLADSSSEDEGYSDSDDGASGWDDPTHSVLSKVDVFSAKAKTLLAARKHGRHRPAAVRFTEQAMNFQSLTPVSAPVLFEHRLALESSEPPSLLRSRADATRTRASPRGTGLIVKKKMEEFNRRARPASPSGGVRSALLLHTQVGLASELQALLRELLQGHSVAHLRGHRRAVHPLTDMIATTNTQNHRLLQDLHAIGSADDSEYDNDSHHAEHHARADNEVQYGHLVYLLQRSPQVIVALGETVSRAEQQEYAHFLVHTLFNRFSADVADVLKVVDVCITRLKTYTHARMAFFTFFLRAITLRSDVQTFIQLLIQRWIASTDHVRTDSPRVRASPNHSYGRPDAMGHAWDLAKMLLRSTDDNSHEFDETDELGTFPRINNEKGSMLPPAVIVGVLHVLQTRNCTSVTPIDFLLGILIIPGLKALHSTREAVIARGIELRFPQVATQAQRQPAWTDVHAVLQKVCRPEEWSGLKMREQAEYAELKLMLGEYLGKLLGIGERQSATLMTRTKPWCLRKLLVVSSRDIENLCASFRRHLSEVGAIAGHLPPGFATALKGLRLTSAQTSRGRLVSLHVRPPPALPAMTCQNPISNRPAVSSFGGDQFMVMHRDHTRQQHQDGLDSGDYSEVQLSSSTEKEIWDILERAQLATQQVKGNSYGLKNATHHADQTSRCVQMEKAFKIQCTGVAVRL
jgi:hypothetical protein